jgi:hypothetical protein
MDLLILVDRYAGHLRQHIADRRLRARGQVLDRGCVKLMVGNPGDRHAGATRPRRDHHLTRQFAVG